jgi:predicted GNAT superfamily acetyltransferase
MPKELVAPNILIRRMQPSEYAWALALNNSEVPHVSAYKEHNFPRFVESAAWAPVAVRDNKPIGFAILFLAGSTYASENYRWVAARYTRFLYLDRIVVEPAHRGQGIGHALYENDLDLRGQRGPAQPRLHAVPRKARLPRAGETEDRRRQEERGDHGAGSGVVICF